MKYINISRTKRCLIVDNSSSYSNEATAATDEIIADDLTMLYASDVIRIKDKNDMINLNKLQKKNLFRKI